jgi:RHS repeat-associated protein
VTGYWTKYTYDVNNKLTGVTQNAQSSSTQSRSYAYDDLGRMTSETNPESGTAAYTYDTDSICGTSKGDLVKKVDAVGNTICFAYDALHRMTSTTYSGTYASVTPGRYFTYDSATVNSIAMVNAKTRMAEAYTCFSPCSTKLTDIGFSYTARGEISDEYEATPNSGGYYHVNQTYWANGALNQLGGLSGLPTITYNVDGKGRIYSASASSGQNPLSSTTYNVASGATQVNLGSSDSDTFTYDPNSDRMTEYEFAVNSQSVTGTLTWNSIGTLAGLAVIDPFNSDDAQTCAYSHDDERRIASVNCGLVWSQTFSYDAFGNINKSGNSSFGATYSTSTNRMTLIGSSTPTYDANGNITNDFLNTYAWDANGRPVTADSVGLNYDALGRMVEQNRSGAYTQIVYTPSGGKLALMSGSSLQKGFIPLTGGSLAVYNSSGLAYYRHSDWIGSSRFASTPTRTMYSDGAYGPFGEPYAQTGTADLSYTGMNEDSAANLYDFPAREYGTQGRWPSPDPGGISSVRIKSPQTWNRYAYVANNPLAVTDPNGMTPLMSTYDWMDASFGAGGMGGGGGDDTEEGQGLSNMQAAAQAALDQTTTYIGYEDDDGTDQSNLDAPAPTDANGNLLPGIYNACDSTDPQCGVSTHCDLIDCELVKGPNCDALCLPNPDGNTPASDDQNFQNLGNVGQAGNLATLLYGGSVAAGAAGYLLYTMGLSAYASAENFLLNPA